MPINPQNNQSHKPLAARLRPENFDEFFGQEHIIGKGMPLRKMIESGKVTSIILWGPPGCGKTTLARLIAQYTDSNFVEFSAVVSGVAEVRKVIAQAKEDLQHNHKKTILFIDEIHRFNKAQQDAFLPHVENGTITLIGATTENPGFEINAPLISRSQVYRLEQLKEKDIINILSRAKALYSTHTIDKEASLHIIKHANGDARTAINAFELAISITKHITLKVAENAVQRKAIYYDKKGDYHYDTISAFIKSMRGSDPDATLYWLARMIKVGEDPIFIARRMVIFASEDISNADPFAHVLATSAMQAVHMVGMPEAQIILAHCATYLATAPKFIGSYAGLMQAMADVDNNRLEPVPLHLRNASNKVMKNMGAGEGYVRYEFQSPDKHKEQTYLPKNLIGKKYYHPPK